MNSREPSQSTINSRLSQLKGYIFEVVIQKWMENNDFKMVSYDSGCIYHRQNRYNFLEFRGRGSWHQIDAAMDYNNAVPFVNPIRLLSEVKFTKEVVGKSQMREFVGVIKDLTENYIMPIDLNTSSRSIRSYCSVKMPNDYNVKHILDANQIYQSLVFRKRYTEIGVFFSANGFNQEAENLAYAHNISTISYKNNPIVNVISGIIHELASEDLSYKYCLSNGNHNEFMVDFYDLLGSSEYNDKFVSRFRVDGNFINNIGLLREALSRIQASFIASSAEGALLHFVSESAFPDDLFKETDFAHCMVYYNPYEGTPHFYMQIEGDQKNGKFYFAPPKSLLEALPISKKATIAEKQRHFKEITIVRNIGKVRRTLSLKLNLPSMSSA